MAVRNHKQVKLQPKHRESSAGCKTVPWLNVSGLWLEKLGFKVGDMVRIVAREKLLIIETIPPEEHETSKKDLATLKAQLKNLIE